MFTSYFNLSDNDTRASNGSTSDIRDKSHFHSDKPLAYITLNFQGFEVLYIFPEKPLVRVAVSEQATRATQATRASNTSEAAELNRHTTRMKIRVSMVS